MTDKKDLLGIDFGTSSVKVLLRRADGTVRKDKAPYEEETPTGWWNALASVLRTMELSSVAAIALSSQTGTYVINGEGVIGWRDGAGKDELSEILSAYPREVFLREIAMPHPPMVSYPIPRLKWIKKRYGEIFSVCQPKDAMIKRLTGNFVSDVYTWRGLADPKKGVYSAYFLSELGVSESVLPILRQPTDLAGYVTGEASNMTGLPEKTPVYLGMNDFFASIVGMGITDGGMFDITGTSEHLGLVGGTLSVDTPLVSGPYFDRYVCYGVTASGGASLDFLRDVLGDIPKGRDDPAEFLENAPPIFLPYLSGERAPIFDSEARGVFFGINARTTRADMAYAVCEGVAFSLLHIYESMGVTSDAARVRISGGASRLTLLTRIKAELLSKEFSVLEENDTSALGAAMTAGVGIGQFASFRDAADICCREAEIIVPNKNGRDRLLKRYNIYKNLYPALKDEMHALGAANQ